MSCHAQSQTHKKTSNSARRLGWTQGRTSGLQKSWDNLAGSLSHPQVRKVLPRADTSHPRPRKHRKGHLLGRGAQKLFLDVIHGVLTCSVHAPRQGSAGERERRLLPSLSERSVFWAFSPRAPATHAGNAGNRRSCRGGTAPRFLRVWGSRQVPGPLPFFLPRDCGMQPTEWPCAILSRHPCPTLPARGLPASLC